MLRSPWKRPWRWVSWLYWIRAEFGVEISFSSDLDLDLPLDQLILPFLFLICIDLWERSVISDSMVRFLREDAVSFFLFLFWNYERLRAHLMFWKFMICVICITWCIEQIWVLFDFDPISAAKYWNKSAIHHLHSCYDGVREVHLRPRDVTPEQCCDHRHEHAYAAAEEANHCRFGSDESK